MTRVNEPGEGIDLDLDNPFRVDLNKKEMMDEKIRANRLNDLIHRIIRKDNPKLYVEIYSDIEAALTEVGDKQWDAALEAAADIADQMATDAGRDGQDCISATADTLAMHIRRLKRSKA